ncbi:MAG: glycosyltransferase family 4 protein [Planctomycetota bacterium]|jgi:glycosyltransferase involved in cell wall biosynthesis
MPPDDHPRIGYVLKMYPRLSETFIVNEILAHEASGLDMEIFSLRSPVDSRFHETLGRVRAPVTYIPYHRFRASELWKEIHATAQRAPAVWDALARSPEANASDVCQALHLARLVRKRRIGHLHAHFATVSTTVARLAAAITGIEYSFTAHAKDIFHESVDQAALDTKLRDAAAVVTVSDFNQRYLEERFGSSARNVQRIYNGLDLDEFAYEPPIDRAPLVVGVGRLVEKKGFGDLIDACGLLADQGRDFRCEIVGDGVLRDELEARVVDRDGLPTVLLESMALGTPCVATAVTGIPELIHDERSGLIAPQHDPRGLADCIARILDDRELGVRLASEGRRMIERSFDIHTNAAAIRSLFSGRAAPAIRGAS